MRGYGVGIATNKPEGLAEDLLRRLGVQGALPPWSALIRLWSGPRTICSNGAARGWRAALTCLVGDTATDRNTTKAAGVPSIL
jgi:phosphoglycolate phosphatase